MPYGDSYNILECLREAQGCPGILLWACVVGSAVFSGPRWSLRASAVSIKAILSLYIHVYGAYRSRYLTLHDGHACLW